MVAAELMGGLGAIKTAFDLAKGLKDIDDAARRNAAIIELQEKILAAQATQSALLERVGELEKEMTRMETWNTEKERYELKDFGGNTFAYELKPDKAGIEPSHRICPNCYQNRHKSILQFRYLTTERKDRYICHECKSEFDFGFRQPQLR